MTRWLVTGSAGLLGRDLMDTLHGEQVTGLTRADLDITDDAACQAAVTATVGAGDVVV
ncbi:MAG: dTDP-4-dehydrorhamnose reductase, partial [Pseudonocardiales bacterium]